RRLDAMSAGADAAQMTERNHHADGSVPAHADHAHVVEKDHTRRALAVCGRAEQCADQHVGAARLVDDRRAEVVELPSKSFAAFEESAVAQVQSSAENDPSR